jgi:hypothetical protein
LSRKRKPSHAKPQSRQEESIKPCPLASLRLA